MIYIESDSFDPGYNLALEEYIFEEMDWSQTYFMLWQNDRTIVIGRNQDAEAEIDRKYVEARGIRVVRRLSGGGAVYHDLGNLNFTFITDREGEGIDFRRFCEPVVRTLASFGVEAQISGRNDLTVDGRKVSGNSQYARNGRVMHHGCILFDTDLGVLTAALRPDPDKIRTKGIRSVSARVANLSEYMPAGTTLEDFKARLLEYAAQSMTVERCELTHVQRERVIAIKQTRYDLDEWNYGRKSCHTSQPYGDADGQEIPGADTDGQENPACNARWQENAHAIRRSVYITGCGSVRAEYSLIGGRLIGVTLTGDFFGAENVSELCGMLEGVCADRDSVRRILSQAGPERYITGISVDQLAELLLG
ncbi:MAG: lipoate--protein ligase [Lachnospiraceae bacterium]|nr:lipoate--protein ligase [Lachnospiraceae bacterium]